MFGRNDEKVARQQTARAELERLTAMPVADLAAELMPAFGADGPRGRGPSEGINIMQLLSWLNRRSFPHGISFIRELDAPVREGLQALDRAGLVLITHHRQATTMAATRLGHAALSEGLVLARLVDHANA